VWWLYQPPWYLLALIAMREILLGPMVLAWRAMPGRRKLDLRAGLLGKLATVSQFAALWAILAGSDLQLHFAIAAAVIGALAVADYLRRAVTAP